MGAHQVETMCQLLRKGNLPELVRILLVEYYDKRYSKSMVDYRYMLELSSENIHQAARQLTEFRHNLY